MSQEDRELASWAGAKSPRQYEPYEHKRERRSGEAATDTGPDGNK